MKSKRGWAIVDSVSGDIIDVSFSEHACELMVDTHKAYEDGDREDGKTPRGYLNKYFVKNMAIKRVEVRLVRAGS